MLSRTIVLTILVAASILAAAIAYAGNQLRGEMIVVSLQHAAVTGDIYGVFHLKDGRVRYCQNIGDPATSVGCTAWSPE
jgi:hypothetical protein